MSLDHSSTPIALAEARVVEARRRLGETATTLQAKLNPRVVARGAIDGIADSGEKALRSGAEAARAHPNAVIGAVTLAAAWFTRHRIATLFRRTPREDRGETDGAQERSIP